MVKDFDPNNPKHTKVFDDTIDTYSKILDKDLELNWDSTAKLPSNTGTNITVPPDYPLAEDKSDLYALTEREIYRDIAKSDYRNGLKWIEKYPELRKAVTQIHNCVEDERVDSFIDKKYIGTGQNLDKIDQRMITTEADTPLDVLIATRCHREDLIPPQYKQLSDNIRQALDSVHLKSPAATEVVEERIFQTIKKQLEKELQDEMGGSSGTGEPQEGGKGKSQEKGKSQKSEKSDEGDDAEEEQESSGGDKQDDEDEKEQDEDKSEGGKDSGDGGDSDSEDDEDSGDNSDATPQESDSGHGGDSDSEGDDDEEQPEVDEQTLNDKLNQDAENVDDKAQENLSEQRIIETEETEDNSDKTDEEIMKQAEKDGKEIEKELDEKIQEVDAEAANKPPKQQKTDFDTDELGNYTQLGERDQGYPIVDQDPFGTMPNPGYNKSLASELDHLFRRIRGKVRRRAMPDGDEIRVAGYIERKTGEGSPKLFTKKSKVPGMAVAFVLDVSGSMGSSMKDGSKNTPKIQAAKSTIMMMYEAVKNQRDVVVTAFAYSDTEAGTGKYRNKYVVPVLKLTRKRMETLKDHGGTAMEYGIRRARADLVRIAKGKRLIINITDGMPNDTEATRIEIEKARENKVNVFTVILQTGADKTRCDHIFGENMYEIVNDWAEARKKITGMIVNKVIAHLYNR